MKLEKQSSSRGVPRRKGRSSFSFLICFRPSPVYDSDGPPHAATSDRSPRWFCFAVRTKKKENRKKAFQAHAPAEAGFKPLPAADESRLKSNASIAKDGDVDDNSGGGGGGGGGAGGGGGGGIGSNKQLADGRASNYDVDFNSEKTDHSQARTNNDRAQINDLKARGSRIGKLDPSIGAAGIMAIALAVMVFVGRSAAIVCLSSFLYIFQFVRISSSRDKRAREY